jgi:hypothetical protein
MWRDCPHTVITPPATVPNRSQKRAVNDLGITARITLERDISLKYTIPMRESSQAVLAVDQALK